MLVACSGGGGGGSDPVTPVPSPDPPEPEPTPIDFLDTIPGSGVTLAAAGQRSLVVSHLGQSDASFEYTLNCPDPTVVTRRHAVIDLASESADQVVSHQLSCPQGLAAGSNYSLGVLGTRANSASSSGTLIVDTDDNSASFEILLEKRTARDEVSKLFVNYVGSELFGDLDLTPEQELALLLLIVDLAESQWKELLTSNAVYDVVAQRVRYGSVEPNGIFSANLTGLVVFPETAGNFTPRDRVLLLTHATGSTPSDLNDSDPWFILATLFASQGYLVVAADNYGRGGTSEFPETYLQGTRTGINNADLLSEVTTQSAYMALIPALPPLEIEIIGYSQGGHSAIATWLEILHHHKTEFRTVHLVSGGAPHNLYKTVRGVVQHVDGSCGDDGYCRFVDADVTVPFATDRILPPILAYVETELPVESVIIDGSLAPGFVNGFLNEDESLDGIKALLQLNSFTNVANGEDIFSDDQIVIDLYHSVFDRLVPVNNTREMAQQLSGLAVTNYDENLCSRTAMQVIFGAVDKVGVVHTLCAFEVFDEVFKQLR